MSYIYLASPYSDPDPAVRQLRYEKVLSAMAMLAENKIPCYCPIAVWHPVSVDHSLPGDHLFWEKQDQAFLLYCREGWFLNLDGWRTSKGMISEAMFLGKLGTTIRYAADFDQLIHIAKTCKLFP